MLAGAGCRSPSSLPTYGASAWPGDRELLITFDDAYRGLRDHAFPVLRDAGFGAVCFLITDYAGRLNRWDVAYGGRRFAHLAWRDMERWTLHGHRVRVSHRDSPAAVLGRRRPARRRACGVRGRPSDSALGTPPTAIAYPFGAVAPRVDAPRRASVGYALGFRCRRPVDRRRAAAFRGRRSIAGRRASRPWARLGRRGAVGVAGRRPVLRRDGALAAPNVVVKP